jgi:selenocysteine-specific elongation factor
VHALAVQLSCHDELIRKHLHELNKKKMAVAIEGAWFATKFHDDIKVKIIDLVKRFHRQKPLSSGKAKTEIFENAKIPPVLGNYILKQLSDDKRIKISGDKVALADFTVEFSNAQQRFIDDLETQLQSAAFNPPDLKEIHRSADLPEKDIQLIIAYLLDRQRVVQIDKDKILHTEVIEKGKSLIREFLSKRQSATVSELKDVLQTSRKWAIPILNYYDRIGLTVRNGDQRTIS